MFFACCARHHIQRPDREYAIYRDISKRKQGEQALLESEALIRAILDNSPNPIFLKDISGRYLVINKELRSR